MGFFSPTIKTSHMVMPQFYIGNSIPQKSIKKSFGVFTQVTKGVGGDINDKLPSMKKTFLGKAKNMGANAVINFKIETGSYQQYGSQWHFSFVILYGEPVIVE